MAVTIPDSAYQQVNESYALDANGVKTRRVQFKGTDFAALKDAANGLSLRDDYDGGYVLAGWELASVPGGGGALTLSLMPSIGDDASFFRLPRPAVTDGELRTAAIPQRTNATNFVGRLDGHVMSALYGTTEALFERRVFPALMDYGGARSASVGKLATADFGDGSVSSLYTTNWFAFGAPWLDSSVSESSVHTNRLYTNTFATAIGRDFSNRFTRVAWPNDLLNGVVYGDPVPHVPGSRMSLKNPLDESDPEKGEHYWLVPKRFSPEAAGPTGTWCLNNAQATAGWTDGHLLFLADLDLSDVFPNNTTPWPIKEDADCYQVIFNLMPKYADDYLWVIDKNNKQGVYSGPDGVDFRCMRRQNGVPEVGHGTSRGNAVGIKGRDLFWEFPTNDPPHVAASNVTARLWGERYAFANVALSLCERSVDGLSPSSWVVATNTTAFPIRQTPRFRFRQRRFSGGHRSGKTLSSSDGVSLRVDRNGVWHVWDLSKFAESGSSATNWVSAVTSNTETVTAAWSESSPLSTADGHVLVYATDFSPYLLPDANPEADFDNYRWTIITSYDGYVSDDALWYSVRLVGTQTNGVDLVAPFKGIDGPSYSAYIGSVSFGNLDALPADISLEYSASYSGVEPIAQVRQLRGPSGLEASSVTNEAEWSIAPAPRAKLLWDEGVIESVDLNRFTTVTVSTNATVFANVMDGNPVSNLRYGISDFSATPLQSWVYFKYDEVQSGISSYSQLLQTYLQFHLSHVEDIQSRAKANPSGNNLVPTLEIAKAVPDGRTTAAIDGVPGNVVTNFFSLFAGVSACTYLGVPTVTHYPYDSAFTVVISPSDFCVGFFLNSQTNLPPRKSAAYLYDAKPVVITNWNFPMMHDTE